MRIHSSNQSDALSFVRLFVYVYVGFLRLRCRRDWRMWFRVSPIINIWCNYHRDDKNKWLKCEMVQLDRKEIQRQIMSQPPDWWLLQLFFFCVVCLLVALIRIGGTLFSSWWVKCESDKLDAQVGASPLAPSNLWPNGNWTRDALPPPMRRAFY